MPECRDAGKHKGKSAAKPPLVKNPGESPTPKIPPQQPIVTQPQPTYSQIATQERKTLLKTWLATVIGTAIAFALVSGVKDIRALVTTSISAGSIGFVVSALGNNNGHK